MTLPSDNRSSNFDATGFWVSPKPSWENWQRTKKCRLWEAVALACDVDPCIFHPYGLTADASLDGVLTSIPGNVRTLLDLARSAVGSGTLKVSPIVDSNLMQSEIDLSDFTTWLNMLGHKAPAEYPWSAGELETGQLLWPWGRHQTKALELLALAADKFWKNVDPNDYSTAPKNATVVAWLEQKGASNRQAEAIASLLRADKLPTGPR